MATVCSRCHIRYAGMNRGWPNGYERRELYKGRQPDSLTWFPRPVSGWQYVPGSYPCRPTPDSLTWFPRPVSGWQYIRGSYPRVRRASPEVGDGGCNNLLCSLVRDLNETPISLRAHLSCWYPDWRCVHKFVARISEWDDVWAVTQRTWTGRDVICKINILVSCFHTHERAHVPI
jgi:hypothetical protein